VYSYLVAAGVVWDAGGCCGTMFGFGSGGVVCVGFSSLLWDFTGSLAGVRQQRAHSNVLYI
jgi:hypothetical protein